MRRSGLRSVYGRRLFITGAAGGIGRATALRAAAEGAELFLTDIDQAGLDATAEEIRTRGGAVRHAEAADITDHPAVRAMAERVHARSGPMDVVMNVAGVSAWGTVQSLEHRHWRSMVEVNLMGPIHVIESFLPPMVAAGRGGHLVNVSSAAGLIGLPWHAAYSAGKFGLRGVSEVLRFDLRRHGIGVSLVCPGAVRTPLTDTVEIAGLDKNSPAFKRLRDRFAELAATPEAVAEAILDGVHKNRYLVHTSGLIRAVHAAQRVLPPLYVLAMRALNRAADKALAQVPPPAPGRRSTE
ncbi:SDR family oxidoreductase [Streptomyces marispadix]|uniref:SDR family oxidoreductase n=1 Tax=Streptomyces marispadix TaxID=2922868 RepID=A0ABS9T0H6_9ACTN|nr:SDR family oxidoreductase [Streptomyces marispadix]MCH6162009.1 SDR family oxidoreductase [Streptomyces marispadix]